MIAVSVQQNDQQTGTTSIWDEVLEMTKAAQENRTDPQVWAIQLSSTLHSAAGVGVTLPSTDLAHLLVSHICWENHVPITWKFLEKALAFKIVPPFLVLALLSSRVIPYRQLHPSAYRLYLELLKRHAFSFASLVSGPHYGKIMKSIDDVLDLSQIYDLKVCEPGVILVEFVFSVVGQLLDASLDDEGLLELASDKNSKWSTRLQDMEIDGIHGFTDKKTEHHQGLCRANTMMAIELIGAFLGNKVTSRILNLARRNMPSHWRDFVQRLKLLAEESTSLRNSKVINPEALLQLASDTCRVLGWESKKEFQAATFPGYLILLAGQCNGTSQSALWLPIDLFLEDAMDGTQVAASSAVEILTGLVKALQALNGTTWHDTFLGLWIAALRLVQRERDPSEGPVPRIDSCLCMLLSVTTLAVADIIDEEESELVDETDQTPSTHIEGKQAPGRRRKDLVTSLQMLGDYEDMLTPPPLISSIANQAAAKAIMFISGVTVGNGYYENVSFNDLAMSCLGNMRHLIVEACIARNLLDTSAYMWPGYVNASHSNQVPRSVTAQMSGWSSLMKGGSPLTSSLTSALVVTPASSLAEIEKVYEIATNGSDDEKISAATVLCGASLVRGWSVQENTILLIIKLLSPPVPADYSGSESHLIGHAPLLNTILVGISSIDCVQIFSLHGLVPLLAAVLMPICEVFGSAIPNVSWTLASGEDLSCHAVFSNAFTLLVRLWRFHKPPLEQLTVDMPLVGSQLSPEYLLLVRNSKLASFGSLPKDQLRKKRLSEKSQLSVDPVFMDSFPKLKRWYRQNQECIASTLSGLVHGTSVHQIVDALLTMMFRKINRTGTPLTSTASGSTNSSGSHAEDVSTRLKVPAWDLLEATPFVLDAALTACAHGKLSPRELATGLKELSDFLPATLATVVSYFSAEVTRGLWKPAFMNGTDWPSPATNLSIIEQQIKKILAATGVDAPTLAIGGNSPATLPLPLAAFVSLTITYKLDKSSDRYLALLGTSLSSLASSCPWPCMPIVASLWAQKVKRWSDYLVFSASGTVFHHNCDAVVQLLKSCFTSTLGLSSSRIYSNGGVGALLGHGFGSHFSGGISPVGPGILYLRVHRSVRDVMFITEEILSILMHCVKDIASSGLPREKMKKSKYGMSYGQVSLAASMARAKLAASLGASLVWISGGSTLVHSLMTITLPSWFISVHGLEQVGRWGGMVAMLGGYALAYFAVFCATFAWGVDAESRASEKRPMVLGIHLDFLASALDGKISLGSDCATWRAYVTGFITLIVACTPTWVLEIDVDVLKRLCKGLRQWGEEELALALLGVGGVGAMGTAAELIVGSKVINL